ncbi:MAG: hypothetical protein R2779_11745 [Crocinitomicaceae bacterium]
MRLQTNISRECSVLPSPIIDFDVANNTAICNGSSITINASGANSYSWNTGASTSGITVSPSTTTTYTVTGTVSGCTANKSITIVVKPNPAIRELQLQRQPIVMEVMELFLDLMLRLFLVLPINGPMHPM